MANKSNNDKKKTSFSKALLIQESILIWIITISFLALAFYSVVKAYFGELPWLSVIVGFPWSAYAISQAAYYRKSMKENISGGIVYEQAMNNNKQTTDVIEDETIQG